MMMKTEPENENVKNKAASDGDISADSACGAPETAPEAEKAQPEAEAEKDKEEKDGKEDKKSKEELRSLRAEVKTLKDEAKKLAAEKTELEDKYLRMIAEYDNYRRRTLKEKDAAYSDAYADALKEILPAVDNLERATAFAAAENPAYDKLAEGVRLTLKQFSEALARMGVKAIGEKGERFDPELHNAVMHEQDESKGESEIAEVFQKGYLHGDKVIRHAMVKVVN